MPYCADCGSHYRDDDQICSSCGRNLDHETTSASEGIPSRDPLEHGQNSVQESREADVPETEIAGNVGNLEAEETIGMTDFTNEPDNYSSIEKTAETGDSAPALTGKELPVEEDPVFPETSDGISLQRFQADSHLGKGIIKPQAVEIEVDGVHFKYDTPSHIFSKPEPLKEKQPREYRFTGSEMEQKYFEAPSEQEEVEAETTTPEVPESTGETETVESALNGVLSEISINESVPLTNEATVEIEPAKEEQPTEDVQQEPTILWEARQTWLGIPLGNIYRFTNHSIIVCGRYNNKLLEVSIPLITGVAVRSSWWSRLFGLGDLVISVREFTPPRIILNGLTQPAKVKEVLENIRQCKL